MPRSRRVPRLAPAAFASLGAGLLLGASPAGAQRAGVTAVPDSVVARVDQAFAAFARPDAPGCALGVAQGGRPVLTRAWGAANLEYGVPLGPESVFESGSVAKQFTAAALVLLARDGKLSLDDDVRKYVPELPPLGDVPITIRQLLNHTSGLRDQWGLLGLAGRGPGSQVHSPATTVDLVSRQRALNFAPNTEFLYSNTGYTLAGVIVERASGQSLDTFSQARLFRPLGMTRTQWRDDHTEIVPGRATSYRAAPGGAFRTDLSFTNVTGNGGLLTTVGDMLTWNAMLDDPQGEWKAVADSLHVRGRLRDGRTIEYALGLTVTDYQGMREVSHGGATAGWRTFLARFPEQRVSVAVLCNTGTANPGALAHRVADAFLARPAAAAARPAADVRATPAAGVTLTAPQLARWAGVYRSARTGDVIPIEIRNGALVNALAPAAGGPTALAADRLRMRDGRELALAGDGARRTIHVRGPEGDTTTYAVAPEPDAARLADYAGRYRSDEVDAELVLAVENGRLLARRRPADVTELMPLYRDGYGSPQIGYVHFTRDAAGRVTGLEITAGRVRHVRFDRVPEAARTTRGG